jgi:hypothetical protein
VDHFFDLVDNINDPYLMLVNTMIDLPIRSGALLLFVVLAAARYTMLPSLGRNDRPSWVR